MNGRNPESLIPQGGKRRRGQGKLLMTEIRVPSVIRGIFKDR
jgi:hypothetical protein